MSGLEQLLRDAMIEHTELVPGPRAGLAQVALRHGNRARRLQVAAVSGTAVAAVAVGGVASAGLRSSPRPIGVGGGAASSGPAPVAVRPVPPAVGATPVAVPPVPATPAAANPNPPSAYPVTAPSAAPTR
ncbi:MAG: hypothetical protein QOI76_1522 [Frankiales bacterium]|nr:hypothetical protein [Frankiales bacterium]